jgi:hypothetical protein
MDPQNEKKLYDILTFIVQEQGITISPVLMDWLLDLNMGTTVLLLEKIQRFFSWTACVNHLSSVTLDHLM